MKTLRPLMAIARLLVLLTLLIQGRAVAEDSATRRGIQSTMHAFFEAVTRVFPWSLNEQQFQDPTHRQEILDALRVLAQHAEQLETHGQQGPQSFDFLRRSLAQSARDAGQRYEQGQYQQARFQDLETILFRFTNRVETRFVVFFTRRSFRSSSSIEPCRISRGSMRK